MEKISKLREYLNTIPPGSIADPRALVPVLAECWAEFDGAGAESMRAAKLHRMEDVSWDPPVLAFVIERHGGTVLGSTRADLQSWGVNVETRTTSCGSSTRRR